jgi:hypothetical protein
MQEQRRRQIARSEFGWMLAVGEIEDFSALDFFTIIPSAWLDTKFFFEDYVSPTIAIFLLVVLPALITILLVKRLKGKDQPKTLRHQ